MNIGEGARTGTLLLDARPTSGLGQHAALGNEDNVTVGELLLKLARQPSAMRLGQ